MLEPTPTSAAQTREVLEQHLTPGQVADYHAHDAFNVRGSNGFVYRVRRAVRGNANVDDGSQMRTVYARGELAPTACSMIATKLLIETDADRFEDMACRESGRLAPAANSAAVVRLYRRHHELWLVPSGHTAKLRSATAEPGCECSVCQPTDRLVAAAAPSDASDVAS